MSAKRERPRYTCNNCRHGVVYKDNPCAKCRVQEHETMTPDHWEPIVNLATFDVNAMMVAGGRHDEHTSAKTAAKQGR